MIRKLLIANRGEIACRVIRTAKQLGITTVAVYSDADAQAQHVRDADEAVRLGAAPATESYLDIDRVIAAATSTGAQAIHPGYGFLSENARFAQACADNGVIFVGPPAEAIAAMGSKIEAKRLMEEAGVPILPGYHGEAQDEQVLMDQAQAVGFPLLIKASAGGGGKGMRLVEAPERFADELAAAKREALSAFGDDEVLLERYLTTPKHIEVQVLADTHGNVVHLFERDCSVQRRHQKVIEEAPGPTVTAALRERLGAAAVEAAKRVSYVGAGTIEFIAQDDEFFFMEMNTRLQVEHPVTEAISGLDLVEWQLRVAAGEVLPTEALSALAPQGHAVEARLYAENPGKRFLPSTGTLARFAIPDWAANAQAGVAVRLDAGVGAGDTISMHYDPMLAKLICHAPTRAEALRGLDDVLAGSEVAGVEHNIGYLRAVLAMPSFAQGSYTTNDAQSAQAELTAYVDELHTRQAVLLGALAVALEPTAEPTDPWSVNDGFRVNDGSYALLSLVLGKQSFEVRRNADQWSVDDQVVTVRAPAVVRQADGLLHLAAWFDENRVAARAQRAGPSLFYVYVGGHTFTLMLASDDIQRFQGTASGASGGVTSPMPGQVLSINVGVGDKVKAGQLLAIVEAMKMEHSVLAPANAEVTDVLVTAGQRVEDGQPLVSLK